MASIAATPVLGKASIEDRVRKAALIQMHLALGLLFVGVALVETALAYTNLTLTGWQIFAYIAIILLLIGPSVLMRRYGAWNSKLLLVDFAVFAIALSGVPAALMEITEPHAGLRSVGFFAIVLLRSVLIFIIIPRSRIALSSSFEKALIGWFYAALAYIVVASLFVSVATNVSLSSMERLGTTGWLTMNNTGLYAAVLIIMSMIIGFIPLWVRVPAIGIALYILILTQSRMALVALVLTMIFVVVMLLVRARAKGFLIAATGLAILLIAIPPMWPTISQLKPVKRMIERSMRVDPTTGRMSAIRQALNSLEESPVFGFGYLSPGSRFENGLLSLALETGYVGLSLYLVFSGYVFWLAWVMARRPDDERARLIGMVLLALTVFIFIRAGGERSHGFQVTNVVANAWLLLAGYALAYNALHPHRSGVAQELPERPLAA